MILGLLDFVFVFGVVVFGVLVLGIGLVVFGLVVVSIIGNLCISLVFSLVIFGLVVFTTVGNCPYSCITYPYYFSTWKNSLEILKIPTSFHSDLFLSRTFLECCNLDGQTSHDF